MPAGSEILLTELTDALRPLVYAAEEEPVGSGVVRLALETGYNLEGLLTDQRAAEFATTVATLHGALRTIVANPAGFVAEIPVALEKVANLYNELNNLDNLLPAGSELGVRLLNYLVATHIEQRSPTLYSLLALFGVIRETVVPASGNVPAYLLREMRWNHFARLTNPAGQFADLYGWGTENLDSNTLFARLADLLWALGLPTSYKGPLSRGADGVFELSWTLQAGAGTVLLGLRGEYLAGDGNRPPGVVLAPEGTATITHKADLGGRWQLSIHLRTGASSGYQLTVRPRGGVQLQPSPGQSPVNWMLVGELTMTKEAPPESRMVLLGSPTATRFEAGTAELRGYAEAASASGEIRLELRVQRGRLIITAGDGDGFLERILPRDGLGVDVGFAVVWSSKEGFHFEGGAGLEVSIAVQRNLGPIRVDSVFLSLGATPEGGLKIAAAATTTINLGPVTATVDRVGLVTNVNPQPPFAISGAFKPPSGVALAVDAGAVTGGGFLSFDQDKEQYAGALHLQFERLTLNAIGLLTTRLPDGSKGFSLLAIVTAEGFTPIQLGFGFTLNGVGGLIGVNRTLAVEAIRAGLRNHSLDSILFPQDPIHNAPRIVSDVRTLFPPSEGRYVFGPMAIIGYGTPPLVEAELAIILELPDPVRLVILGQATLTLPRKGKAIVELHLDVLGIIDFGAKLLSLDARLHDSKISFFNVFGDMALRLSWGAQPSFALSIGGLHPRYQPPPGFPELRRVTVALGTGRNPRLTLQGYLAVTSNSLQFGARAELYAEAAGFNLYGWVGFDALFIFSPFSFLTEFTAGLALRRGSSVIASIQVDAALSGPSPWRARGKASISLLFFRVSVGFDATFGSEPRSDPAVDDPWKVLKEEIGKPNNWSAVLPPTATRIVAITQPPSVEQQVGLLDPAGGLALHQRRVPLDHTLVRFGQGRLPTPRSFEVEAITVGDHTISRAASQPVTDLFAPALFDELSDVDKLTRPSFDRMTAGLSFGADTIAFGPTDAVKGGTLDYTTTVIDGVITPTSVDAATLTQARQLLLTRHAATTARSPSPTWRSDRFVSDPLTPPHISLAPERYTVVAADTLAVRGDILETAGTKTAAAVALAGWLAAHPQDRGALQIMPTHELVAAQ